MRLAVDKWGNCLRSMSGVMEAKDCWYCAAKICVAAAACWAAMGLAAPNACMAAAAW